MDWREFWNGEHSIYVNPRHRMLHDRLIARDIAVMIPSSDAVVLDYACGEASAADDVARRCGKLMMADAAPSVRERLLERYRGSDKVSVLSPDEVAALPDASVDLIVVNSLLQYLSQAELEGLLVTFRRLLKENGALVIGDVLPRDLSTVDDVKALLRFGYEGGFLIPAVVGLFRTFFSDYRRIRSALGLARYDEGEMLGILERAGFLAERRRPNLGHNDARMTFVAHRAAEQNAEI